MTDNDAYRTTLTRIEQDIQRHEAMLVSLRAAKVAIDNIVSADAATQGTLFPAGHNGGSRIPAGTSMKQAAAMAMEKAGKPLNVRQIYTALMQMGFQYGADFKTFRGSMTPTLNRDERFKKVAPGQYALANGAE